MGDDSPEKLLSNQTRTCFKPRKMAMIFKSYKWPRKLIPFLMSLPSISHFIHTETFSWIEEKGKVGQNSAF